MSDRETFGEIINRLMGPDVSLSRLSREADVSYPHLHSVVSGTRGGKEARASAELVQKVVAALREMGKEVTETDEAALLDTVARLPEGFRVAPDGSAREKEDDDWGFLDDAARDAGYDGLESTGMTPEEIAQVRREAKAIAATILRERAKKK